MKTLITFKEGNRGGVHTQDRETKPGWMKGP